MKLASDPMPFSADPLPESAATWPPRHPARSPLEALVSGLRARFADGPLTRWRRAAAADEHPEAIGASDRELARLGRAGWTVEDARTDSLRRFGGHRRPAL